MSSQVGSRIPKHSPGPRRSSLTSAARSSLTPSSSHHHKPSSSTSYRDLDIGLDSSSDDDHLSPSPSSSPSALPPFPEHKEPPPPPSSLSHYDPSLLSTLTTLQAQLQQKDDEVHQLSSALLLLKASPSAAASNASTAALLKDLMRKQRDLNVTLTRERQQHAQALLALQSSSPSPPLPPAPSSPSPPPPSLTALQAEVASLTARLSSSRLLSSQLKTKVDRLTGLLTRELGDPTLLSALLREEKEPSPTWRGRAERVDELEARVRALTRRLREREAAPAVEAVSAGKAEGLEDALRDAREQRAARAVLKARVRALEGEMGGMKERLLTLLDKSDGDDRIIDRLKADLSMRTSDLDEERRDRERERVQAQRDVAALKAEVDGWRAWKDAAEAMARTEKEGREKEWATWKAAAESTMADLQGRCDDLERERADWRRTAPSVDGGSRGRNGPRRKGDGEGEGKGERVGEVKRRLLEMVGERELIRESYAAMLSRRDADMERFKAMRDVEKEHERSTRIAMQHTLDDLSRHLSTHSQP